MSGSELLSCSAVQQSGPNWKAFLPRLRPEAAFGRSATCCLALLGTGRSLHVRGASSDQVRSADFADIEYMTAYGRARARRFVMDPDAALALIGATAVLVAIPGPNVALIVANTIARGLRFGAMTALGTTIGVAVQLAVVVL